MSRNGETKGHATQDRRRTSATIAEEGLNSSEAFDEYTNALLRELHAKSTSLDEVDKSVKVLNTKLKKAALRSRHGQLDPILRSAEDE